MYNTEIPDYGDLIPVSEFILDCQSGGFIDFDGYGHPTKDGKMDETITIRPSKLNEIPSDCEAICWFNR